MDYVIYSIIAYLLGSIPFSLVIGKTFYQTDIREHGSGNLGGTNTFRVLGWKAGLAVTILDILKGTLAVVLVYLFAAQLEPLIVGAFAVIGHSFPLFAKFKGGKAVATSGGVLLGVSSIIICYYFCFVFRLFKDIKIRLPIIHANRRCRRYCCAIHETYRIDYRDGVIGYFCNLSSHG